MERYRADHAPNFGGRVIREGRGIDALIATTTAYTDAAKIARALNQPEGAVSDAEALYALVREARDMVDDSRWCARADVVLAEAAHHARGGRCDLPDDPRSEAELQAEAEPPGAYVDDGRR